MCGYEGCTTGNEYQVTVTSEMCTYWDQFLLFASSYQVVKADKFKENRNIKTDRFKPLIVLFGFTNVSADQRRNSLSSNLWFVHFGLQLYKPWHDYGVLFKVSHGRLFCLSFNTRVTHIFFIVYKGSVLGPVPFPSPIAGLQIELPSAAFAFPSPKNLCTSVKCSNPTVRRQQCTQSL